MNHEYRMKFLNESRIIKVKQDRNQESWKSNDSASTPETTVRSILNVFIGNLTLPYWNFTLCHKTFKEIQTEKKIQFHSVYEIIILRHVEWIYTINRSIIWIMATHGQLRKIRKKRNNAVSFAIHKYWPLAGNDWGTASSRVHIDSENYRHC